MRGNAGVPVTGADERLGAKVPCGAIVLLLLVALGFAALAAVPAPASAWVPHTPIVINGNLEFTPANGVTAGSGTPADPYIIEGWEIDGSANSGIEIYGTDAHFVIRDVYVHSSIVDAIYLYSVRNGTVQNATVSGNDGALYIQSSSYVRVTSSNISFNVLDAVVLDSSSNVTVEGNEMWSNGDWGVFTYGSDDLEIRNNTIVGNGWAGIELDWANRVTVRGNLVANHNVAGLMLNETSNVTIVDNAFPNNDYNVDLTNSYDILIRNNTIATSTTDGLTITGGARLTVEENNITGNGGGLLAVGATDLRVRHNAFVGNSPQASDVGGANAWDDGYPSGGNYWDDYVGADDCSGPNQDVCSDPDGIGDTPYDIDADTQDRYPLMQPYGTPSPPGRHARIVIVSDGDFTAANGVTGGSGTPADPYVIAGWDINAASGDGVYIANTTAHFVLRDTAVHDGGLSFHGVSLNNVSNARIESVTSELNMDGILLVTVTNLVVATSTLRVNDRGVDAYSLTNASFLDNRVTSNTVAGIQTDGSSKLVVERNYFSDNDWAFVDSSSVDIRVAHNNLTANIGNAISLDLSSNAVIENNTIEGNLAGIYLNDAPNVRAFHNQLVNGLWNAQDTLGIVNGWDDGYPSGGNYWSDYGGVDNCSGPNQDVCPDPDGIGDTPYVIDADSQDRYPLMQAFVPKPDEYLFEIIPPLPGDVSTVPWGLNAAGDVVGWSWDGQRARPFLFTDAAGTTALPTLPGRANGTARDISDSGFIVGSVWDDYLDQPGRAVRWRDDMVRDLGVPSASTSEARGVNETGAVAGWMYFQTSPSNQHGFLYTDAMGTVDVTPGRDTGFASDVNEAGVVTGYMTGFGGYHAFRWSGGSPEDLGAGTFAHSFGYGINEVGQVAGCLGSASGNTERAARYTTGVGWEVLGGVGQVNCGWRINAFGDVVGHGRPGTGGIIRAFLYVDGLGMLDLETLIDPALGLRLLDATDINDEGQIVGRAWSNILVEYVGFRLTPRVAANRMLVETNPAGLQVQVDGTDRTAPFYLSCVPGSVHQIAAPSPQAIGADTRYAFSDWSDGGSQTHDFVCEPGRRLTASYRTEYLVTYQTLPTGLEIIEDGAPLSTPHQRWCAEGQVLGIGAASPQFAGPDRYDFVYWSDGGAQFHTITCGAPQTYTAVFLGAPYVTLVSPNGGESLTGNSVHAISWIMGDPEDSLLLVSVNASTDGGLTFPDPVWSGSLPIGPNSHLWTLPALDRSTTRVQVCVADSDGGWACDASDADFAIDSTPPSVAFVSPGDGEANVGSGEPVVITFSEPMNPATFPLPAFSMSPSVGGLAPLWSPDSRVLSVAHDPLLPCTTYTGQVNAGGSDVSFPGNAMGVPYSWSFTTRCPPTVELLSPRGGEEWTGGTSHEIDLRTSDETDGQLRAWINATVDGIPAVVYAGPVTIGVTSLGWEVPTSTATASVTVTVVDSSGLRAATASGLFAIDATPPMLLGSDPPDEGTDIRVGTHVVLTFSEPMDPTSVRDSISIQPAVPTSSFTWDGERRVFTVSFGSPLTANTDYAATVGCAARDDSIPGNVLGGCPVGGFQVQFRTEILAAPPVASATAISDARAGVPVTFDARGSTGEIVSWAWTVATSTGAVLATLDGAVASYAFAEPATYRVTLVVTDAFGRTDEYSFDVVVLAAGGGDANVWVLAVVSAAVLASALVAASEPGRVAIMTATLGFAYGRKPKDEKDSEIRGAILYYVRVHPGDCYMDIKRNLVLNDGVVTYHLARLEKDGLLRSAVFGARKRYYPAGMNVPAENGGELHEIQQRLIRLVATEPGMPVSALAEQLGVSGQLALYHLRKLAAADHIDLERRGLRLRAFPPSKT